MKRLLFLSAFLAAGTVLSAAAQAPATAAAPSAASGDGPKVAVIQFQAAVTQTNEFQRGFADVQKKFAPQQAQIKSLSDEIDTLTKQLQTTGANLSPAEQASRAKTIDDKKKQAQRMLEDAQNDYQAALQDLFNGVASKVDDMLLSYAKQQGFTLVVDATEQQNQPPTVLYANPSIDITSAIIGAYNVKSGVPAPPPAAAAPPAAPKPSLTTP
jgi:outer membrane protein